MTSCEKIKNMIKGNGFQIMEDTEDARGCTVDFKHPTIKPTYPMLYWLSSVVFKDGILTTTVRARVDDIKTLALDYCCEDGKMVCRPHVNMTRSSQGVLSVEATFKQNPIMKFEKLLKEMI